MPYKVVTTTTPLWADHQKTLKKGKVSCFTEFFCTEFFQDMLKTDSVLYTRQDDGELVTGDGWLELKNCTKVEPFHDDDPTTPGGIPIEVVSGKKKYLITIEEVE